MARVHTLMIASVAQAFLQWRELASPMNSGLRLKKTSTFFEECVCVE